MKKIKKAIEKAKDNKASVYCSKSYKDSDGNSWICPQFKGHGGPHG